MRNNTSGSRRQKWLNMYRIFTTLALSAILVMGGFVLDRLSDVSERSFAPITVEQTDKVTTAASFLETAGFARPVYLGIKPTIEGEYPTFSVEAIGGQSLEVLIRTMKSGGLQIQPAMVFETVSSADDFASLAARAIREWENIPPEIQPLAEGSWGEYESRKYNYEQLSKYKADYGVMDDETTGWPRK